LLLLTQQTWRTSDLCLCDASNGFASAEEANIMKKALDSILATDSAQALCCQLALCTSFQAFEMLCAQCELRGLVFVHSHNPHQKLGEVFYDRDCSRQHDLISGALSSILAGDLRELAGEATSDLLIASLQLKWKHPVYPLQLR